MVKNKHYQIINRKAAFLNPSLGRIKPSKILKETFENFHLYVRLPQSVAPLIGYYTL
jgi:hypothetical protein